MSSSMDISVLQLKRLHFCHALTVRPKSEVKNMEKETETKI